MKWRLAAAWGVTLILTTAVVWSLVDLADSQVSIRPVNVETLVAGVKPSTTPPTDVLATSTHPSSTVVHPTSPSSPVTSTSIAETSSSTIGTSSGPEDTPWNVRSIKTEGGTVVVRFRLDDVTLQAATPEPGYEVKVSDGGPERVRVEFEGSDVKVKIELRCSNGALQTDIGD